VRRGRRRGRRSIPPWRGVQSRESESGDVAPHPSTRPWRWTARNARTPGAIQRERERNKHVHACGGDALSRSLGNIREYGVTTGRLDPCEWGPGFAAEVYKVAGRALDDISTWREKCRSTAPALHSHPPPRILGCGEPRVVAAAQHEDPLIGGQPFWIFYLRHVGRLCELCSELCALSCPASTQCVFSATCPCATFPNHPKVINFSLRSPNRQKFN
jgi:hypothetical protein